MRIAICDDEKAQRSLITKYLQEWARENGQILELSEFPDAESLLFCWEDEKRFDLLILDIEMGALSGMELAERIRRENEDIPILFITGYETYMARGHQSLLSTAHESYQLRHSITELWKMLDGQKGFVRSHRSYLVNLRHISAITRTELVMDDFRRLPISRGAYRAVNAAFIANYGVGVQR